MASLNLAYVILGIVLGVPLYIALGGAVSEIVGLPERDYNNDMHVGYIIGTAVWPIVAIVCSLIWCMEAGRAAPDKIKAWWLQRRKQKKEETRTVIKYAAHPGVVNWDESGSVRDEPSVPKVQ